MIFCKRRSVWLAIAGLAFMAALAAGLNARAEGKKTGYWPESAEVYFIYPNDGEQVTGRFEVIFGLTGLGVAPAGVEKKNTGHHHLLIDTDLPANLDEPLPSDAKHRHFGGGQTQTSLMLPPGKHTLQLVVGDHNHIPHDPPLKSKKITITVKAAK